MKRVAWVGLAVRWACVPFLLQWFHPDERQLLEFAHFHAHGRLHPFLESHLHLRNQSLPWLFSWLVRACDLVGLSSPRAWLFAIHFVLAAWSWIGFLALLKWLREEVGEENATVRALGWVFALFWGFCFIYSRPLLESVSSPATFLLLLYLRRGRWAAAGFWAGAAAVLRYPSALWAVGAVLVIRKPRPVLIFSAAFAGAMLLGGLADLHTYGGFLESAPSYWSFNRPNGPVQAMFGDDSLSVYWHWFEYLFTPWLAPLVLVAAAYSLVRVPVLGLFCLPYIAGHLWTPHREPRFMIPLTPLLLVAIARSDLSARLFAWARARALRNIRAFATFHVLLNFAWFPLYAVAQWGSGQAILLRHYSDGVSADLVLGPEAVHGPMIDALIPAGVRWTESPACVWHRPGAPGGELRVLSREEVPGCEKMEAGCARWLERFARVRASSLWKCAPGPAASLCPKGISEAPAGEPLVSRTL